MRTPKSTLLGVGMLVAVALSGCGESSVPTSQQPSTQKAAAAVKAAPAPQASSPASVEPPKYVYETVERRDPFVPLVSDKPVTKPGEGPVDGQLTPLQQYALDQFRLIGVIIGKGQPAAMVAAPDGKGYVLRRGVKIGKNNGVVISISASSVVVEEQNLDFSGALLKNQVELKLTKAEGAK
jgi:type IV pilus assembly protein PilP